MTVNEAGMNLRDYDFIVINSSAGKDSQAMLDYVAILAKEQGVSDRLIVVHADLGKMEWDGTKALAARQAAHYGIRFEVVRRTQNNLLEQVEARGMWPSSAARYCTSDHKRGPIGTLFTKLSREAGRFVRILNCMGMRAQESPKRAKMETFAFDKRNSNGKRHVDTWLPIHTWTVEEVWARIRQSGVEHHRAYDMGMPRLSCVFCIFSPKAALLLAGKHNPELLAEYVAVEKRIDHTFRQDLSLATIQAELQAGVEPGRVQDWTM